MARYEAAIELNVGRTTFDHGLLIYFAIVLFGWRFYVQRWDNARCPMNLLRTRDGYGWTAGIVQGADTILQFGRRPPAWREGAVR